MAFWRGGESLKVLLGVAFGMGIGTAAVVYFRGHRSVKAPLHCGSTSRKSKKAESSKVNLEEQALLQGGPRVKFGAQWIGTIDDYFKTHPTVRTAYEEVCDKLSNHMFELEQLGATPIAPDGKVGGNCSALLQDELQTTFVVSKSGKAPHKKMDIYSDFAIVSDFDTENWSCRYYAQKSETIPTSDTPLHHAVLLLSRKELEWEEYPSIIVHGHAFETEYEANERGYPISSEETLFSTKEDAEALMSLLKKYPYPNDNIYIRKGHGFVLLARDMENAFEIFGKRMKPFLSART